MCCVFPWFLSFVLYSGKLKPYHGGKAPFPGFFLQWKSLEMAVPVWLLVISKKLLFSFKFLQLYTVGMDKVSVVIRIIGQLSGKGSCLSPAVENANEYLIL